MYSHQFHAMGCRIQVWLDNENSDLATAQFQAITDLFAVAEARLSRFRPDSELSWLNGQPERWVTVSPELWLLLHRALSLARQTDGLFDPALLAAVQANGYRQSFQTGAVAQPASYRHQTGLYRQIRLDRTHGQVWLPAGAQLDLGAIAKGYTAQQAIDQLSAFGPCLIDAGGDLTAGPAPTGQPGWPVGVAFPDMDADMGDELYRLYLHDMSLATSGTDYRRWRLGDQETHHIIDPETGRSALNETITVSVLAADAALADVWATALLIPNRDQALDLAEAHGLAASFYGEYGGPELALTSTLQAIIQVEAGAGVTIRRPLHAQIGVLPYV